MNSVNPMDEAELRHEFKQLYKDIGPGGMTQVLYEIIFSANVCIEVMLEESKDMDSE